MIVKVLYVLEKENGEKFYFVRETDRNAYCDTLRYYEVYKSKRYEINLKEVLG